MKTAYLFPGQGSQYLGMGRDLCQTFEAAVAIYDRAAEALGFDLRPLCFDGPERALKETRNTQPALLIHSLAVLATLGWEPKGPECVLAGHSLGEYTAYVAAGSISLADGVRLVRRRGELMHQAGIDRPGTMAAVLGLSPEDVEASIRPIEGVCVAANINSPTQVVISGELPAIDEAVERLGAAGAKRTVRLPVAGAFHSPLMESAAAGLAEELSRIEIRPARCPVIANASARPVTEPAEIRASLTAQLLSPVRWLETMERMRSAGVEIYHEIGAGKVLSGLVRAFDRRARTIPLGTAPQIEAFGSPAAEGR